MYLSTKNARLGIFQSWHISWQCRMILLLLLLWLLLSLSSVVRCSLFVVCGSLFVVSWCFLSVFCLLWIVVAAALTAAGVSFFRALKASPNKSWFWVRVRTRFLQQFEVSRSKHHGSCHAIGYLHHFFDYQCAARSLFGPILGTPRSMYSQRHSIVAPFHSPLGVLAHTAHSINIHSLICIAFEIYSVRASYAHSTRTQYIIHMGEIMRDKGDVVAFACGPWHSCRMECKIVSWRRNVVLFWAFWIVLATTEMETTERADDWLLGALTVRFWREQFECLSKFQMRPKSQAEVFIGVASQHCVASFLILQFWSPKVHNGMLGTRSWWTLKAIYWY